MKRAELGRVYLVRNEKKITQDGLRKGCGIFKSLLSARRDMRSPEMRSLQCMVIFVSHWYNIELQYLRL